jgi:hypothetical protein
MNYRVIASDRISVDTTLEHLITNAVSEVFLHSKLEKGY